MKKILYILVTMLFINGCNLEEYYTEKQAIDNFNSMCERYELAICGDIEVPMYTYTDMNTIRYFFFDREYTPTIDDVDTYDYMTDVPMTGDCEDFVITFIEDNLMAGHFDKGEVLWMFGTKGGVYHAWALVAKDGALYMFDAQFRAGLKKDYAYDLYEYREMFVVYSY